MDFSSQKKCFVTPNFLFSNYLFGISEPKLDNIQTVISLIYTYWNDLLSTFLHESDILDDLCKVSEKNKNKISNLVFSPDPTPPFWSKTRFSIFLLNPSLNIQKPL